MKISVINVGLFCLCFLSNSYATSDEWSQRWKPSSARFNDNLVQANLIELRDSDYYDGLGKNTIYSTTTNTSSVGTIDSSTNNLNISGSSNGISISGESVNEAPISSNTEDNSQKCLNLSNKAGDTLC